MIYVLTIADTARVPSFLRTRGIDTHAYRGVSRETEDATAWHREGTAGRLDAMFADSTAVRRWFRDPRVRALLILLVIIVALALAWHLVGMADHAPGKMAAGCLMLLTLAVLVAVEPASWTSLVLAQGGLVRQPAPGPWCRLGRDPPPEGSVLRR